MSKIFTAIMAIIISLSLNIRSASASINTDCSERGCVFVLTNTSGILAYYGDDGTSAGSLTVSVGSGGGAIAADEGYVVWARTNSNLVWVYNVAAGGSACSVNVGTPCGYGNAKIFGAYAYKGCGASVKKISLSSCSTFVSIPITGSGTYSIAKDATTIYVLSADDGTISTILPPAEVSSSFSIGRQMSDYLWSIVYANGALYSSGVGGIYQIPLPLSGTSSLFQALPFATDVLASNGSYIAATSMGGDLGYLVPLASPASYLSVSNLGCLSVSISDDTWYTVGGATQNTQAWDFSGTVRPYSPLTTVISESVAYAAPTVTPPICGDGTVNGTDVCDGMALAGQTCVTRGYDYGNLACLGDCSAFDETDCHMNCGNGSIEAPEQCDGTNYNGADCTDFGFDTGSLSCDASCNIITTACEYNCGNGSIEAPEQCDGSNHNGQDCTTLGFDSGSLSCSASCTFVTTACINNTCGNGSIDNGEDCDGTNLNGQSCLTLGRDAGNLSCSPTSCTFDQTGCIDYVCGNNVIEGTEACDGANLNGASCSSLGLGTGDLACTPGTCVYNTSGCSLPPECGNGVQETGEECDNGTANSDTEPDACRTNCSAPACGDGVTDTAEQCDDNNLTAGDGCDESCVIETPPDCGNGSIDANEDCDGVNLNGASCESLGLGYTGGVLACNAGCAFDTTGCTTDPVCNTQETVTEVADITSEPDLIGKALEIYNSHSSLTPNCAFSCAEVGGVEVVWVETSTYCNVRTQVATKTGTYHLYPTDKNGVLLISKENKKARLYSGGRIMLHDGENFETSYGENEELGGATLGTSDVAERWNTWKGVSGRWLLLWVTSGSMRYFETANVSNVCTLLSSYFDDWVPLNLDILGTLKDWEKQPTDKPDCNGCSQTDQNIPSTLALWFVIILGLYFRLFHVKHRGQKETVRADGRFRRR